MEKLSFSSFMLISLAKLELYPEGNLMLCKNPHNSFFSILDIVVAVAGRSFPFSAVDTKSSHTLTCARTRSKIIKTISTSSLSTQTGQTRYADRSDRCSSEASPHERRLKCVTNTSPRRLMTHLLHQMVHYRTTLRGSEQRSATIARITIHTHTLRY